jgi:hypothetical protein
MKKTFILSSMLIFAGLTLNLATALSQDERRVVISTGDRMPREEFLIGQDIKSTRLNLSKHFEGETASNTGTFKVEEGIRMLEITIKGSVKEGSIKLTIIKPDKSLFKEQLIDRTADVEWSQHFSVASDNKEYTGDWIYKIEAVDAMGFYGLSIMAH